MPPTGKGANLGTYINFVRPLFIEENVLDSTIHLLLCTRMHKTWANTDTMCLSSWHRKWCCILYVQSIYLCSEI